MLYTVCAIIIITLVHIRELVDESWREWVAFFACLMLSASYMSIFGMDLAVMNFTEFLMRWVDYMWEMLD